MYTRTTKDVKIQFHNQLFKLYRLATIRVCLDRTYFTETENWKNCSKIIFKCVNSIVGPIFNEKVAKKWDLWIPWTVHGTHWCVEKSNIMATVHEQCMNSNRNSVICSWNTCQKKKGVKRANMTQKHVSKRVLREHAQKN